MQSRPRYTTQPLPPYSYVPGYNPHPVSDPKGHMHGHTHETPSPLVPSNWNLCKEYLHGIDLFNHGFYWEAHEAWESLWHVAGRKGIVADFLKGLIKYAAMGVKVREGNPSGVQRHAKRANQLLSTVLHEQKEGQIFCGLELIVLIETTKEYFSAPKEKFMSPDADKLLDDVLRLSDPMKHSPG